MHPIKVPRLIVKGCTIFPSTPGNRILRTSLILNLYTQQLFQKRMSSFNASVGIGGH